MFGQTRTGRVEDVLGFEFGGLSCSGMAPARFTGFNASILGPSRSALLLIVLFRFVHFRFICFFMKE